MEIIKEISHRVNSNSSIFASAQIIPCYWHNTTATPSLTAHYFCSYKLYKKALSVADPGQGPSQPLICRQKWGPKGQKNISLHCPLPPPPLISRSPSMKSPFLGFLIIHTGYWSVLFSLIGWSFINHHIISSRSITIVKWIWSKLIPKHF